MGRQVRAPEGDAKKVTPSTARDAAADNAAMTHEPRPNRSFALVSLSVLLGCGVGELELAGDAFGTLEDEVSFEDAEAFDLEPDTDEPLGTREDALAAGPRYENIVLDESGDPFAARFGKTYHLYLPDQLPGGGRVLGFTSKDLVTWKSVGSVFDNVAEQYGGQKTRGLWAPEVLKFKGKYYLFYVNVMTNPLDEDVGDKDIVVIESDDPTNFKNGRKRTVLLDGKYAFIDPSPFVDPATGKLHLLYKRRGALGTGTELMIRPMSSPTAFSGPATVLVRSKEIPQPGQLEHPMLRRVGQKYFLLFSKGLGDTSTYQIVYATSRSPTGPFTYRGALFTSSKDLSGDLSRKVIAPGASSIVRDGAGKTWMVYRQKKTLTKTYKQRGVCIDRVVFDPPNNRITGNPTKGVKRQAPAPLD